MSEFPDAIIAAAKHSQATWHVPAAVTLAQWAIESAYGAATPPGSNNPFGIKAVAGQPHVVAMTREVLHGRATRIPQRFAKYASLDAAFDAHAKLLATSHFYTHAMAHKDDPDAFANALTGVYATDPHYGAALIAVMRSFDLYQYDRVAASAFG